MWPPDPSVTDALVHGADLGTRQPSFEREAESDQREGDREVDVRSPGCWAKYASTAIWCSGARSGLAICRAPSSPKSSQLAFHERLATPMRENEDLVVERRLVAPRSLAVVEHPPAYHHRARPLDRLPDQVVVGAGAAALFAVRLQPARLVVDPIDGADRRPRRAASRRCRSAR
jgi:hypothetical protein